MTHIELLNEDVQLATTFTLTTCCDACNADGGGSCSCDTYVCSDAPPPPHCILCDRCDI